jgi:hypothetical protein
MVDVAALSFAIDSSDSRRAKTDLDALKLSASEVAEAQVKVNRAIAEGRDPMRALRAELELFQRDTTNAQRSIEGLVGRLNELTQSLAAGSGNMRELRQMVGQIEAAATAFNTTAVGMEMFVRTSRNIGISSAETSQGLARISSALRDVSEEGERARRILRDYGVSTEGRGGDPAAVLREFTERLRAQRMDARTGSDIQALLGPMTTAGIAALLDPEYRTIGQRQRDMTADAEARRIAELRNGLVASRRERELRNTEDADLEREYGWHDRGQGWFQSDASRRRELERLRDTGAQSRSTYERSPGYIADPMARGYATGTLPGMIMGGAVTNYRASERALRWLGSDEFSLRAQTIEEDALNEAQQTGFWGTFAVGGRALYRHALNAFGTGEVTPRQDTRPVNERVGGFNSATDAMSFQGSLLPFNRQRQRMMIEAANQFGVETAGFDQLMPQDIMARLSPNQRYAIERREETLFANDMSDLIRGGERRQRMAAIGRGGSGQVGDDYGLEAFAGNAGGTEAEADRAQRIAEIIVRAETTIGDARRRGIRIRQEVAELDRQIDERRARASDDLARRIADAEEEGDILGRGGATEGTGAALRARRALRASQQPGAAGQAQILQGDFAQEVQRAQQTLFAARRQGEQQEYLLGALRRGDDPVATRDSMQVNQQLAPLREAAAAMARAGQEGTAEYGRMLDKIKEIETSIRAQLIAERERTREIGAQNTILATQRSGLEESILQRDRTYAQRSERDARRTLALRERPAPDGEDPNEWADRQLQSDSELATRVEDAYRQRQREQAERERLAREERLRATRVGGSGDPVVQRQRARDLELEELRNRMGDDPGRALEEQIRRAQWASEDADRANAPIVSARRRTEVAAARAGARYGGIRMTPADLDDGARTIVTEENNPDARLGVAATILNRVLAGNYGGSTVSDVVRAPGQFEVWQRGQAQAVRPNDPALQQARQMLMDLVQGMVGDPTGGATFFYGRDEMARRGTLQNHRWAVNPDGSPRAGVDLGGSRFLTAPDGADVGAARGRLYGPDAAIAGAARAYAQDNPGVDVRGFTTADVQQRVEESMERFRTEVDRNTVQMETLSRSGLTPFQQGLAQAIDQVRPLTENLRRLAARPETTPEQRLALLGQAQTLEDQQRDSYIAQLRARDPEERQRQEDEIGDLQFTSGYFFSSRLAQRDLAERQLRRSLERNRGDLSSNEVDERVQRAGQLAQLREQDRLVGMMRDGWYQLGNSAGQALERIILQGGKATDVLRAMMAEMAAYYTRLGSRILMQQGGDLLQGGFNWLFGTGSAGTVAKGATEAAWASGGVLEGSVLGPMALGGVLDSRSFYTPLAQGGGGIFSHAQYVPMANGGTALVAEAGPEAAVPLVRMPSGNLGVRTGGGGGPAISNNFNVTVNGGGGGGGGQGGGQRMGNDIARALEGMVTSVMVRQLAPGGVLNDAGQPTMR